MNINDELVHVYSGSIVDAERIKQELEQNGIYSIGKDEFRQGLEAGFGGGVTDTVDLFVTTTDAKKAIDIISAITEK
jgi:hypothetical protein